jgi:assimilatory nitrate reductase catalytic subunit
MSDVQTSCVKTTCPYCGVGCGVNAQPTGGTNVEVTGDKEHGSNFGLLCSKGSALGETTDLEGRLLQPQVGDRTVDWDSALDVAAKGFKRALDKYGPDRVAFYVSGQLLTEDYYVANKLMKGYIGGANIDTNSRLCMSSAVAGHKRAFGNDIVPGCYEDLEEADLVVLVGSNTAWCHPIVFQRIIRSRKQNPNKKIVTLDPRRTPTAEQSDLHIPLKPGTDVLLFNGLLAYLHQQDKLDAAYISDHTENFDAALNAALTEASDLKAVAEACDVNADDLRQLYEWFADNPKTVTVFSQGVNQSTQGTDKVNSIINCHLGTGRVGKPGASPFSITGQPNAMGGREVGGLANMLAAHMGFDNPQHPKLVQEFWNSPKIAKKPGFKAVEMFDAINDGYIKAVWIMATNPAVSLPNADLVNTALDKCEFVVVSDCIEKTDTTRYADVLLPATGWGEKDGTVTNSERRISRQRSFLPKAGDAKPDWWIICEIAKRMGYASGFPYRHQAEIFNEHAALSGYRNDGQRDFDISDLVGISADDYNNLQPFQWPLKNSVIASDSEAISDETSVVEGLPRRSAPRNDRGTKRMLGDGKFFTPSGKAQFIAVTNAAPANAVSDEYPLVLNSGRIRDHWHTMTRTGKSPKLSSHLPEPFIQIHPADAAARQINEDEFIELSSNWGKASGRARITDAMRPGEVFMPIHWSETYSSNGGVGSLVNPAVDPISGEPEFKHTPVQLSPLGVKWYGFILSRQPATQYAQKIGDRGTDAWVKVKGSQFWRYEFAGTDAIENIEQWARAGFGLGMPEAAASSEELGISIALDDADWIDYRDPAAGVYRAAWIVEDRIEACVFVSPTPDLPARSWLASVFAKAEIDEQDRQALLLGEAPDPSADVGPIVCSCFGVGKNVIKRAIAEQGCKTAADIGGCLKAGTNCGSCVPELDALLAE